MLIKGNGDDGVTPDNVLSSACFSSCTNIEGDILSMEMNRAWKSKWSCSLKSASILFVCLQRTYFAT